MSSRASRDAKIAPLTATTEKTTYKSKTGSFEYFPFRLRIIKFLKSFYFFFAGFAGAAGLAAAGFAGAL
jgi:hypothetical protein